MEIAHQSVNTFDLDKHYFHYLYKHFTEHAMDPSDIKLGKIVGDLLREPLKRLKGCDFLVAGPPCPPWAAQGNRNSVKDARAMVFFRILVWCYFLAHCKGLIAVVLENVVGISHKALNNGVVREPVIDMFLRVLRKFFARLCVGRRHFALGRL